VAEQSLSATRDFAENFIARILLFGSHAEIDGHPWADSILKKIWYVVARKLGAVTPYGLRCAGLPYKLG
jgi:hypothetical protein